MLSTGPPKDPNVCASCDFTLVSYGKANMIHARDLRKAYAKIQAVDGVSLKLVAGETFGLLGPNGAGKTTIHMLIGALRPDDGEATINGSTDPTRADVRRQIGVAPQVEALYDELSATENLSFFGRLYGLSGDRLKERVSWCLGLAELTARAGDRVKKYSGGMKRRLNLACALVHDPPVLLLDEPTAGVDPQSRNHLLDTIEEFARAGRTILYTTHYMEEAERLCDRVAIMDQGKILALDTVNELLRKHGGPSVLEAELARIPDGVSLPAPLEGNVLRFATDQPFEEANRLRNVGVQFVRFHVDRPSLESVFLNLTGRRLRD
jgi:ABC-2 type transport system ATP-binding protein